MRLPLDEIVIDPEVQSRDRLDAATVERYIEMLEASEPPPVIVFDGNLLADGFHRVAASTEAGREEIEAEKKEGGKAEAIAYAVVANTRHGLPLTRGERNEGIRRLHALGWSNRRIGKEMLVDHKTVGNVLRADAVEEALPAEVGKLPQGLKLSINALPKEQWEPVARVVQEAGLTERQTRKVVKALKAEPTIDLREIRRQAVDAAERQDPWIALHSALEAGEHLAEFDVEDLAAQVRKPERAVWLARLDTTIDLLQRIRATVEAEG